MGTGSNKGAAAKTEDTKIQNYWDQFKIPGLKPSMSISDFVNQLEHCISEQINSGNPQLSGTVLPDKEMLEELVQCLFSDSQMPASDEKSVMTKVNSFCSLLQAGAAQGQKVNGGCTSAGDYVTHNDLSDHNIVTEDNLGHKAASISRKDSFGDLLMQLPRITSLPQFLFNIQEDEEDSYPPSP